MQVYFRLLKKCGYMGNKADNGIMKGTFRKIFGKYLFLTNTLTCGGLMAVGDSIQQELEIHRGEHEGSSAMRYDWNRINRMFWVGLAQGPPQHVFYKWLDRIVPKRDFPSITKKIVLDQLIASPMCLVIFFVGLGLFEKHEASRIISEMKSKFLIIYTVDWIVWPPVQMINFYYLPPKYRVIYVNIVTMLYDVFLSYVKHDVK
ncbi:mpv17-like protein 2 [Anabrus simplex]|uniref:mpv17-like protein 2 n=1 Tax=Anabrus simplex TaxID=316456 RepID=UPI0035A37A85